MVIYFLVLLAGGKADGAPPGLDFLYLLGKGVPLGGGANLLPGNGFHLFTEGFLSLQVLGLLLLEPFEMGLVLLVDYGGGGAETLPDLFAEFLGHGAQVLPLLMEFLEFLEGIHHIVVLRQGLGRLAEGRLGLQVLLEIQIPELAVNVHQVVELGHIQLVGVVHVAETLLGNRAHLTPAVLDVPELGESVLHVSGLLHQGLELLDDGLLPGQVLLPLGVQFLVVLCTLLLIGHVQRLETGLDGGKGTHRAALEGNGLLIGRGVLVGFVHDGVFPGFRLFLGKTLIKGRFDGLGLLGPLHAVFTFRKTLEQTGQFGQGFLCEIHFLFLLGYICGFFVHHRLNFFTHSIWFNISLQM